jgi:hypothetical protein
MADNTLSQQISDLQAQVAALTALMAPKAKSKKTDASAPSASSVEKKKRAPPDPSAWNAVVSAVWQEMKESYFSANPSARDLSDSDRKAKIKSKELPPFPTYQSAMVEASRRRGAEDPEHAKKSQARRANLDALQAEKAKEKKSKKKADPTPSAPAPAPSSPAPAPTKSEPEIITNNETEDPEEFNMTLNLGGRSYSLNAKNWVLDEENEWVGLWDSNTKTIDTSAPEPE